MFQIKINYTLGNPRGGAYFYESETKLFDAFSAEELEIKIRRHISSYDTPSKKVYYYNFTINTL